MPGDLNLKKSWNPALLKNQKKVWEREQDALKEYQVIKQRRKEIEQEREKEELIRLQYGNDPSNVPSQQKLELNKLGWMYTDVPDSKEPELNEAGFREIEEDFQLKKDDVEQLLRGGHIVKKKTGSRFDSVATVGANKPASSLSDDPLLMIRREHLKTRPTSRDRERSPSRRDKEDSERHKHSSERDRDGRHRHGERHRHHERGSKDKDRRRHDNERSSGKHKHSHRERDSERGGSKGDSRSSKDSDRHSRRYGEKERPEKAESRSEKPKGDENRHLKYSGDSSREIAQAERNTASKRKLDSTLY